MATAAPSPAAVVRRPGSGPAHAVTVDAPCRRCPPRRPSARWPVPPHPPGHWPRAAACPSGQKSVGLAGRAGAAKALHLGSSGRRAPCRTRRLSTRQQTEMCRPRAWQRAVCPDLPGSELSHLRIGPAPGHRADSGAPRAADLGAGNGARRPLAPAQYALAELTCRGFGHRGQVAIGLAIGPAGQRWPDSVTIAAHASARQGCDGLFRGPSAHWL